MRFCLGAPGERHAGVGIRVARELLVHGAAHVAGDVLRSPGVAGVSRRRSRLRLRYLRRCGRRPMIIRVAHFEGPP